VLTWLYSNGSPLLIIIISIKSALADFGRSMWQVLCKRLLPFHLIFISVGSIQFPANTNFSVSSSAGGFSGLPMLIFTPPGQQQFVFVTKGVAPEHSALSCGLVSRGCFVATSKWRVVFLRDNTCSKISHVSQETVSGSVELDNQWEVWRRGTFWTPRTPLIHKKQCPAVWSWRTCGRCGGGGGGGVHFLNPFKPLLFRTSLIQDISYSGHLLFRTPLIQDVYYSGHLIQDTSYSGHLI
jgi:hypothetical protein